MHALQDTILPATAAALHEQFPEVAAAALPPASTAASEQPSAPAAPPDGQDCISVPRGYLEYLEGLVQTYAVLPGADGDENGTNGESTLAGIQAARAAGAEGAGGGLDVPSIAPATLQLLMQSNK
jgi:hypothetical protein